MLNDCVLCLFCFDSLLYCMISVFSSPPEHHVGGSFPPFETSRREQTRPAFAPVVTPCKSSFVSAISKPQGWKNVFFKNIPSNVSSETPAFRHKPPCLKVLAMLSSFTKRQKNRLTMQTSPESLPSVPESGTSRHFSNSKWREF